MEGYRFVSVVPLIANGITALVVLTTPGCRSVAAIAFLILIADTGGLPWFLVATWRDKSMWDRGT